MGDTMGKFCIFIRKTIEFGVWDMMGQTGTRDRASLDHRDSPIPILIIIASPNLPSSTGKIDI